VRRLSRPRILAVVGAAVAAVLALTLVALRLDARRDTASPAATVPRATVPAPEPPQPPPPRLAIGLAEQNPYLIAPGEVPAPFAAWRDRAVALRPRWFRLIVDWSKVQPDGAAPPDWNAERDGCLRGEQPCAPYGGVRDLLRAIAARRTADNDATGWEVVASVHGAPAWARDPAPGCPAGGRIRPEPYKALLRSLERLARDEGVRIRWWSPWNEPNHPAFLAPQRAGCSVVQPAISPGAYADLVRAAQAELPASARLVLGEVAGYDGPRSQAVGAAEFAAALPPDVVCAGDVWGQHAYIGRGSTTLAADRDADGHAQLLGDVKAALDAHRCPRRHRIWITETGATGIDACAGMDTALRAWEADPRVDVAVQYTFREDPAFRVGLADPALSRELPAYAAWLAWGGARDPAGPPPPVPCAA
jgi:hypothetical protein